MQVSSVGRKIFLEKEMATHPSILAWETPWTIAYQAPLSMGFPRQEYWGELPCPPSRDLLDPGMELTCLMSPALAGRFFSTSAPWEAFTFKYNMPKI